MVYFYQLRLLEIREGVFLLESCTSGKSDVLEKLLNSVFPITKKSSLHNLYFIEQMYFFGGTIRLYFFIR